MTSETVDRNDYSHVEALTLSQENILFFVTPRESIGYLAKMISAVSVVY